MSQAESVFKLLQDEDPDTNAVIAQQLQQDFELRDAVLSLAEENDQWPRILLDLMLMEDSADLISRYAQCDDLETGMCLLPKLDHPRRECLAECRSALDGLAEQAGNLESAIDIAYLLTTAFGFSGDHLNYHDPRNSFLPDVLERRCGLPIVLTAMWILICRRLDRDAAAIAVPGHVYGTCNELYIDLFDDARLISDSELNLHFQGYPDEAVKSFLEPASDRNLLQRMARNLVNSYHQRGDSLRAAIALRLCASKPGTSDFSAD